MLMKYMTDILQKIATMPHILVVDDDQRLRDLLLRYLGRQECMVMTAENTACADQMLKRFEFDIMIVDVMMPGEDGITYTRRLRTLYPDMPVLMLTAKNETEYRIEGLEAGVDDYLPKPFEPRELWLRIKSIIRRTQPVHNFEKDNIIKIGDYTFNIKERSLTDLKGGNIFLTESETALLSMFADSAGEVLSREDLARLLGLKASERTIDVQITRLRKKLEPDARYPRYLQTVRGKGYVLKT